MSFSFCKYNKLVRYRPISHSSTIKPFVSSPWNYKSIESVIPIFISNSYLETHISNATRVRIHVYFKFTQTLALGCRNCRLSLPSNHNLRYISYSYNYKHRRASTLDGSIAPSFHRGFNRGNVCASSAPTAGQPARFDPFNLNGAKLAADRSIPLSSLPFSTLPISLFSRSKIRERSAWRGEAWRTKACVPRRKSTLGPLIKRARVYASHDHHHHRHHHLPPPSLPRRERGVEKRSIKSLVYGRPHSSATPFLQHILQPSPLLLRHSATLLGRPTCSFHPHQPLPRRGGGQRPLSTRSRVCRSAARWRWSARKGD